MSDAKIDIKIGQIQFSGQGEQDWVAKQLDKIIAQAEKLIQLAPPENLQGHINGNHKPMGKDATIAKKTLPVFLTEKGAAQNQVKKFLATAIWLEAKGQNRLKTGDVVAALKASNQSRLANASDALKRNMRDGKDRDVISQTMQLLAGRTGQEYNQGKNRKSAFWEDRYHATAVETGSHLAQCMVYIDLNMVRAGVVAHPSESPLLR